MTASASHSDAFQEWMALRRCSVRCNHYIGPRRVERIIARGLSWEDAGALTQRLTAREHARPGRRSSWTGRIFLPRLDTPPWRPR